VVDIPALIRDLGAQPDLAVRRALILCLNAFDYDLSPARRRPLVAKLLQIYRDDSDPNIHAAAELVLVKWGHEKELPQVRP
jgi:hypothetical protein